MRFLDILAKLGILRFGVKSATYKNAAERPAEFMMDNVLDSERDLVAGGDKKPDTAKKADKP